MSSRHVGLWRSRWSQGPSGCSQGRDYGAKRFSVARRRVAVAPIIELARTPERQARGAVTVRRSGRGGGGGRRGGGRGRRGGGGGGDQGGDQLVDLVEHRPQLRLDRHRRRARHAV